MQQELRREALITVGKGIQNMERRERRRTEFRKQFYASRDSDEEMFLYDMSTEDAGLIGDTHELEHEQWNAYRDLQVHMRLLRLQCKNPQQIAACEAIFSGVKFDMATRSSHRTSVPPILPGQYDEDEKVIRRREELQMAGEQPK